MIIIDDREDKYIQSCIEEKNIIRLEAGDYIVKDLLIERKSPNDFVSSILNRRIFSQLINMKENNQYKPLLAITGNVWRGLADKRIQNGSSMIFGTFKTIVKDFEIPIIQFDNEKDFIFFLKICDKEKNKKKSYLSLPKKKAITDREKKLASLTYIDGVSVEIAKKLLSQFSTIKNISNVDKSEFLQIEGIGKKLSDNIFNFFNY
jgi:ERCC4-type nuclease